MDNIIIRKGEVKDIAQIYDMIRELADFEGVLSSITITEQYLLDSFTAVPPSFMSIVAEDTSTGRLIGHVMYYNTFSSWSGKSSYIEDIYLRPESRRLGLGSMLFKELIKTAIENGSGTCIMWNAMETNTKAINFYTKIGANNITESEGRIVYRMDNPDPSQL